MELPKIVETMIQGKRASILRAASTVMLNNLKQEDAPEEAKVIEAIEALAKHADMPKDFAAAMVLHGFMQSQLSTMGIKHAGLDEIVGQKVGNC